MACVYGVKNDLFIIDVKNDEIIFLNIISNKCPMFPRNKNLFEAPFIDRTRQSNILVARHIFQQA